MKNFLCFFVLLATITVNSQTVNIIVDATQNRKKVSPFIYGKNNSLSVNPDSPLSESEWQLLRDAGVMLFRENSGNNATKYNWRLKLHSAPDWYNNVYSTDWDYEATSLQQNIPGAKAMYALQLIGKAASNKNNNFNDWGYNNSGWWPGVNQNLAGGGTVNTDWNSTNALVEGNPNLYLQNWTADSTVGILDKWFGTGSSSLNLNKSMFQYWNMDNEPEIWEVTHDDVLPNQMSAESFMLRYFEVAKKARAKYPDIKLVGFVACSEWYWYAYPDGVGNSGLINYKGKDYTWIEFFIMRIAEEQKASGIRLIDVIDLHSYLSISSEEDLLQAHRVFYDKTYEYPAANGVKTLGDGGWDSSIKSEYIFARINDWLVQYLGENHGVTLGSTESGWNNTFNQMPLALNYASTLGVFANEGVEVFTPWFWSPSYWEVVHLFSKYSKDYSVKSQSSDETNVSAYTTVTDNLDSLTLVLVNRNSTTTTANVALSNFLVADGTYNVKQLYNLPDDNSTQTFVSHTDNALKSSTISVSAKTFFITLPAYSVSSVMLSGTPTAVDEIVEDPIYTTLNGSVMSDFVFPNPVKNKICFAKPLLVKHYKLHTLAGQLIQAEKYSGKSIDVSALPAGMYLLTIDLINSSQTIRILKE